MPNDKPKPEPKPSVTPTPEEKLAPAARPVKATQENFGMLLSAVLHIQQTTGEQIATAKDNTETKTQEHLTAMETIKILSEMKALNKFGAALMLAMAGV